MTETTFLGIRTEFWIAFGVGIVILLLANAVYAARFLVDAYRRRKSRIIQVTFVRQDGTQNEVELDAYQQPNNGSERHQNINDQPTRT